MAEMLAAPFLSYSTTTLLMCLSQGVGKHINEVVVL